VSSKQVFEIDGSNFATLEEFYDEISRVLLGGKTKLSNLDVFHDILRWGFGTPEGGFTLRWKNSERSRQCLGYAETVRQLELRLQRCHPSNQSSVMAKLELAKSGQGETAFDWLVQIIKEHGPGGSESEDGVDLVLD
jgi:RNAse (barnase) inhibitor barstar